MEILRLGSRGPNVKLIQSLLNRIGYNAGAVDGIFGAQTQQAVIGFQRDNGLTTDGIVGSTTWRVFNRLLLGYDTYTIKAGDTLFNIGSRYYTTVNAIITANPGINPNALTIGQQIIVPYGIDIVFTDIDYTYDIMERQISGLKARYPFLETSIIGNSIMGKNLYCIRLGKGPNKVTYNASHHANEWITTSLLMKFVENFSKAHSNRTNIRGYNVPSIWESSSIYIIPMVNPDGVDLVNYWPNYPNPAYHQAARLNNTSLPLPRVWKANIRGVDLNSNYPADWELDRELKASMGITGPAPRDWGGPAPLSEPESSAMANFTRQHNFRLVLAYHTQGQVIFYQYQNLAPPIARVIAEMFSRASGYDIAEGPAEASYAGYKDWFIQDFRRPGYTIEAGIGVNPLPITQFPTIYNQNEEILLLAAIV